MCHHDAHARNAVQLTGANGQRTKRTALRRVLGPRQSLRPPGYAGTASGCGFGFPASVRACKTGVVMSVVATAIRTIKA